MSFSKNLSWSDAHKDFIEERVEDWASGKYWRSCKHLTGWSADVNVGWFKQQIFITVEFEFEDDQDLDFDVQTTIIGSNEYTINKLRDYWVKAKQELEEAFNENYSCCFKE